MGKRRAGFCDRREVAGGGIIAYTCHAHPTHSEAIKEAAMAVTGESVRTWPETIMGERMMAKHGLWAAASLALSLMATSAQAAPDLGAANAQLTALLDKNYPALDALYRDLHPESRAGAAGGAHRGILAQHLRKAGFTVTEKVGGTGVVGVLKNGGGPTILIRADMDALPMEEKTGLAGRARRARPMRARMCP